MTSARPYLLIIVIGLILYAPSAFFGLSYLDDNILTVENRAFLDKLSNIAEAFRQDVFHVLHEYDAAYRPLLTVSFIIDTRLDALSGIGYHFSNIVFHLIASCLVFLFFLKLRYSRPLALFFALAFTVHPALVQAVAWIPGRNESLLGIFVLSGFLCLMGFIEHKRWPYLAGHIAFFLAALFTKEAAVVLPFVCIGYLLLIEREKNASSPQRQLLALWCLALALWFALRACALSSEPVTLSASAIAGDMARGLIASVSYLGKAVFPLGLSIVPVIEDMNMAYGVMAIAAIALGLALSKEKRYRHVLFGAAWFLLFLAPTFIQPVAGRQAIFLESRLYLPILGVFIVLGEIDFIKNAALTKRCILICAPVICLLFIMSAAHAGDFKDAATFWERAAGKSPHSSLAQYNLGWIYDRQGDLDSAERQYLRALELDPRQRYAHNSLGTIYERKGLLERARAEYIEEIKNTPYSPVAYRNLANLRRRQGNGEGAAKEARPEPRPDAPPQKP